MDVITSIATMKELSAAFHKAGETIGFVPTMGALHEGHISLLEASRRRARATVMSIFVNPTQFAPGEDFKNYPRPLEADCAKAEAAGCDIVFAPAAGDMYPAGYATYVSVEGLSQKLCGVSRPIHFRGVTTVVLKFFNIVNPNIAFFGSKDAQQVIILKRMALDLHLPVAIEVCPTARERDGVAMSSRNSYLTPAERAAAPVIFRGLSAAAALFDRGERDVRAIRETIEKQYRAAPLISLEYVEITDTITLNPLSVINAPALVAVACRTKESATRLIDNIVLGGSL